MANRSKSEARSHADSHSIVVASKVISVYCLLLQARSLVVSESSLYDVWDEISEPHPTESVRSIGGQPEVFFAVAKGFKPSGTGDRDDHHHLLPFKSTPQVPRLHEAILRGSLSDIEESVSDMARQLTSTLSPVGGQVLCIYIYTHKHQVNKILCESVVSLSSL